MRAEAEKRIGDLYPKVAITEEMARERPDLTPYVGRDLTVIAWLWARTVKSPNPAFADVDVPLVSTFMLSTKVGKTPSSRRRLTEPNQAPSSTGWDTFLDAVIQCRLRPSRGTWPMRTELSESHAWKRGARTPWPPASSVVCRPTLGIEAPTATRREFLSCPQRMNCPGCARPSAARQHRPSGPRSKSAIGPGMAVYHPLRSRVLRCRRQGHVCT